jgi:lipopolysaccharide exporter
VSNAPGSQPSAGDARADAADLTTRTLRGLKWTYLAALCSGILQIGVTATMSRLLTPADYGLIAAAGLFLRFGSYFSEMGVGQALVQKLEIGDEDIRAAFTASSGIGLLATAVMCACAPLARVILDTSQVVGVVQLIALCLFLNGLASTSLNLLRRNLRFDVLSKIELGSYAISYGLLGIPLALAHCGVWALTTALLAQPLLTLVFAYAAQKHSLRPSLAWRPHRALLSFGFKMSFTSFAEYIFFFAEPSVVGRMWGSAVLGIYNRATLLANLPVSHLSTAFIKVLFPAFSRAQNDNPRMASAYLQGLSAMGLITLPLAFGMVPAANDLALTVLGGQYGGAASLVQVLALGFPMGMIASVAANVTNARGEIGPRLAQQVLLCALMWIGVLSAAPWGIRSVVMTSVIIQAVRMLAFHRLAMKSLRLKWRAVLNAFRPGILLALCVTSAVFLAAQRAPVSIPAVRLIAEVGAAGLVCLAFAIWFLPLQVAPFVVRALEASPTVSRLPVLAWYKNRIIASLPA